MKSVLDGGQDVLPETPPTTILIHRPSPSHPQQGAIQLQNFNLGGHVQHHTEEGAKKNFVEVFSFFFGNFPFLSSSSFFLPEPEMVNPRLRVVGIYFVCSAVVNVGLAYWFFGPNGTRNKVFVNFSLSPQFPINPRLLLPFCRNGFEGS